jgi:hypothetical protein
MSYDSYDREKEMAQLSAENPKTEAELKQEIAKLEAEVQRQDFIIAGIDRELSELIVKRDSYDDLIKNNDYVCKGCANALYTESSADEVKKKNGTSFTACLLSSKAEASFLCNQFIPIKSSI